jgi:hypothetical protein
MAIPRLTWKSGENLKKLRPEFSTDLLNLPAIHMFLMLANTVSLLAVYIKPTSNNGCTCNRHITVTLFGNEHWLAVGIR